MSAVLGDGKRDEMQAAEGLREGEGRAKYNLGEVTENCNWFSFTSNHTAMTRVHTTTFPIPMRNFGKNGKHFPSRQ